MQTDPLQEIRAQIESIAADPKLEPAERSKKLTLLRDEMADVAGAATRHLNDSELRREAESSVAAGTKLRARQNASIRESMIARGDATAEDLDKLGYLSHAELDRLTEEGLLESHLEQTEAANGTALLGVGPRSELDERPGWADE